MDFSYLFMIFKAFWSVLVRGRSLEGVPVKIPLPQEARMDPRCLAILPGCTA